MKTIHILSFCALLSFWQCDRVSSDEYVVRVNRNIECPTTPDWRANEDNPRKVVLLEEFTGHQCGNCPEGHALVKTLSKEEPYASQLAAVAIHSGGFAQLDEDKFTYDFTTPYGTNLSEIFSVAAYPSAIVDRTIYKGQSLPVGLSRWQKAIDEMISKPAYADLQTSTTIVDNGLCISLKAYFVENYSRAVNYNIVVVENKVVKPQKDYNNDPEVIVDYEHNHVLRGDIEAGVLGYALESQASYSAGADYTALQHYIPLGADWVSSHLEVIAFITDAETQEVIQVSKESL